MITSAHRLRRRSPEDSAIAGVDNIPESAYSWRPLTTIRQGLQEAGSRSVLELGQSVQQSKPSRGNEVSPTSRTILLQPRLIARKSTRPSQD